MGETTTGALQKRANKIYKLDTKQLSTVSGFFNKDQLQILHTATPEEHVHHFPESAGAMAGLPFVTGAYMKHVLDRLVGGMWSFEIKEKGTTSSQIWVLGRLTLFNSDGVRSISKEQFGRAVIKLKKGTDVPVDIGNDMKAAATDALKKCASEIGIARDVYAANEFIEAEIVDKSELADVSTEPESEKVIVDGDYKLYTAKLLAERFPATFDRTKYLKSTTNKIRLDSLNEYDWRSIHDDLEAKALTELEADHANN